MDNEQEMIEAAAWYRETIKARKEAKVAYEVARAMMLARDEEFDKAREAEKEALEAVLEAVKKN